MTCPLSSPPPSFAPPLPHSVRLRLGFYFPQIDQALLCICLSRLPASGALKLPPLYPGFSASISSHYLITWGPTLSPALSLNSLYPQLLMDTLITNWLLNCFITFNSFFTVLYMVGGTHMHHGILMASEDTICYLLPPCGSWDWNSGHWTWRQVLLPAEPRNHLAFFLLCSRLRHTRSNMNTYIQQSKAEACGRELSVTPSKAWSPDGAFSSSSIFPKFHFQWLNEIIADGALFKFYLFGAGG